MSAYTVEITGTNTCVTTSYSYTLTVDSLCYVQDLALDPSSLIFASPAFDQCIYAPPTVLSWTDADVVPESPATDCGPYVYTLTPPPTGVTAVIGATPDVSVNSNDPAVLG